jgi:XRE family transcriptional regulator, regulator of sulfur utilization
MQVPGSIKKERLRLDYTQEYVAGQLAMTQQAYSDLESGKTNLREERARQIARLFDIDMMLIYRPDQEGIGFHTVVDEIIEQLRERLKSDEQVIKSKEEVIKSQQAQLKLEQELLQHYREECERLREELKRERERRRK